MYKPHCSAVGAASNKHVIQIAALCLAMQVHNHAEGYCTASDSMSSVLEAECLCKQQSIAGCPLLCHRLPSCDQSQASC